MRTPLFFWAAAVLTLGAASSAHAQVDLTTYISVGDSLAAGVSSASLVAHHQQHSVPSLIARQGGVTNFEQPWVSAPGIPAELMLTSLRPTVIVPRSGVGSPANVGLARPYNNLAVPGATLDDALNRASDDGGSHDLVLRGLGTQVQQAVGMRPSLLTVWIGNNDVLGAAVRGRAIDGVTLTPADVFRSRYSQLIATLRATGARIVAANLPDATVIPYVTTLAPAVPDPTTGQPLMVDGQTVPLLGPAGPLPAQAHVTLAASSLLAQGYGVPVSLGGRARIEGTTCVGCLPDEVVLDPSETQMISDRVRVNNQAIADICGAAGIPVVDLNGLLQRAHDTGLEVGGVTLNSDFLTGGLFSYDGIHLTDLGHAVAANEWIRTINAAGGNLPLLSLADYMGLGAQGRPGAEFEWGLEAYRSLLELFPPLDGGR